jgi:SAM-dependent methyltransferase
MDDLHTALDEVRQRVLDREQLAFAKAGGQRKGVARARWTRVELRPVDLRSGSRLQITTFDEKQAFTANHQWGTEAEQAVRELLSEPFAHWHVASASEEFAFRMSKGGRVLVTQKSAEHKPQTSHDRFKSRFVPLEAPFLAGLGLTTAAGELKKSRASKYRQVEEFVRLLDASVRDAHDSGRLRKGRIRVVDLGCGNAYLTLAAFHHLRLTLGLDVEMVGIDAKRQARERNNQLSRDLGWDADLHFVEANISDVKVDEPVDVVLALHACDTATDDALARAIQWRAPVILAAPCCHHDIQRQLRQGDAPRPYGPIVKDGLLRERWADVLTDALRAALLRQQGYRTDVVEFVDSEHTPRNVMLRAQRTHAEPRSDLTQDYADLVSQWQVRPRLAVLLEDQRARGSQGE